MTEIAAQRDSTGILYEPYHDEWKECVFEEADVQGRNERYEFRCDSHLECCGRVCCVPTDTSAIPLWLLLLFLLLGLLLLLSLLALLAYLCCRKKKKEQPKKVYRPDLYHGSTGGYRTIKHADDGGDDDSFYRRRRGDDYDDLANGYGNRGYATGATSPPPADASANTAFAHRFRPPSFHEEETFEESFKEEIEVERSTHPVRPSSLSSQDSLIIHEGGGAAAPSTSGARYR